MERKSFASIESKEHPDLKKYYKFSLNYTNKPNDFDLEIVQEIINFKNKFNLETLPGTGEWKFLQNKKQKQYINELNESNVNKLANIYANMFRNDSTYGYLSPSFSDIRTHIKERQVLSNILCNIDTCIEFTGIDNFSHLTTNKDLGSPYGIPFNNGFILPDTPRHFYYAKKILDLFFY